MKSFNKIPKSGAKGFGISVMPSRDALDRAISDNGQCEPRRCWHKLGIAEGMVALDPDFNLKSLRLDAGHVKLRYKGWRYVADTPRHVKRSLMLFDLGRYGELYIRQYRLRFRRTTKIIPVTRERLKQIYAAQDKRRSEGREKPYQPPVIGLRRRVEGFSGIV